LRAKSTKKSSLTNKIAEFKQDSREDEDNFTENPLLRLAKQTKKEKRQLKTTSFNEKLANKVTFNTSSGISKSSKRRQKRKEKEQLKPKMDDLLTNLPETTTIVASSTTQPKFLKSTKPNSNQPNAAKVSGHKKIFETESKNFVNVLKNDSFRQSPFEALKAAIRAKQP